MSKINRVFQISDGLAKIAGKKIKAAVAELKKERVLTPIESKRLLSEMSKAKKRIYDTAVRELKKVLTTASKSSSKKKRK